MSCMQRSQDLAPCRQLMRDFEACKNTELISLQKEFEETGVIPSMSKIRKPDSLRDMYYQGAVSANRGLVGPHSAISDRMMHANPSAINNSV